MAAGVTYAIVGFVWWDSMDSKDLKLSYEERFSDLANFIMKGQIKSASTAISSFKLFF